MTTITENLPGTIGWFDLMTTDVDAAYAFYGRLFTWSYEVGADSTNGYAIAMSAGRPAAGIGPMPPGAAYPPAWTVYFMTTDIAATAARITEHGGTVLMGPHEVPESGHFLIATDVTGAPFGVWQAGKHRGAEAQKEHGCMMWCEVATRDAAVAGGFYGKVFDLEAKPLAAPGVVYSTLHRGLVTVAGVMQMDAHFPADTPPHWLAYFQVDDLDAACGELTDAGGTVKVPGFETPYGKVSIVCDPQRATFALIMPPPPPPEPTGEGTAKPTNP